MADKLEQSIGLIVGKKNYILLDAGTPLPVGEKTLNMGSAGGEINVQVTAGESDVPAEVRLIGRGVLKVPRREQPTKLVVALSADEQGRIRMRMTDTASGKERSDTFSIRDEVQTDGGAPTAGAREENDEAPLAARVKRHTERSVSDEIEERFAKKGLIGLSEVKRELSAQYNTLLMSEDFRRSGSGTGELPIPWNFFIGGGAGSGKHTIAEIIAELLYDNGMTDIRAPLVVNAIGLDPAKPGEFFEGAGGEGRTVVIENCELVIPEEENADNTKLWLYILTVLEAAHERQDHFYILLGRRDAFEEKLRAMPQLARAATMLTIPEYDAEELQRIAGRFLKELGFALAPDAAGAFERAVRGESTLSGFAGAHSLKVLIRDAVKRKSFRYVNGGAHDRLLAAEDFVVSEDDGETLEELLAALDAMTGLARVKKEVRDEIETIQYEKLMTGQGGKEKARSLHMMFLGNPGTGKTVTARLIARIYGKLGLLPRPDLFIEADRSSLIGAWQGHTEKATKELVERAMGGVLFIDEAHRLVSSEQDDYGKQALGVLIKNMEDYRDRLMVIFAGYDNMEQVLAHYEPGITRRISKKLHFDDYSQEELFAIFCGMLKVNEPPMVLDEKAQNEARMLIRERSSTPNFGNAGGVRNIADEVAQHVRRRLLNEYRGRKIAAGAEEGDSPAESGDAEVVDTAEATGSVMQRSGQASGAVLVRAEDILACGGEKRGGATLSDLERELNGMIGLSRIKEEVRVREDQIRMEQARVRMGEAPGEDFFLHAVFYGNAGTGKTTVARLIGKIYNKMGVLPAGDVFVEATRADLVAEYMGQTAVKTRAVVESALGGVLFIDEAYALHTGERDEFGLEALNTLLTLAVDYRDRLMIILAGYKEPMDRLLKLNQGLDRRFPNRFHFEDYSKEELGEIFFYKLKKNGRTLQEGAEESVKRLIAARRAVPGFGNAGGIDNLMKELIDAQAARLRPHFASGDVTPELLREITREDVEGLNGVEY